MPNELPDLPYASSTARILMGGMNQSAEQQPPFVQSWPALLAVLTPMSLTLLAQARAVATQGQYQFAVVLAQAACELRTEDAIIELMRHRKAEFLSDALLGFVPTTSLADHRLRKVFNALTGDDPMRLPWWSDWKESRELRHKVAHEGGVVTSDQATRSIDLAEKYVAHLTYVVEKVRS